MKATDKANLLNKILIIEDEPDISDYLYDTLAMSGYEVRQAYDGIEGLEKISEDKPNLVLLDIMMPRAGKCRCFNRDTKFCCPGCGNFCKKWL
jgi:CheY-like chemotaxis protein